MGWIEVPIRYKKEEDKQVSELKALGIDMPDDDNIEFSTIVTVINLDNILHINPSTMPECTVIRLVGDIILIADIPYTHLTDRLKKVP